MGSHSFPMIFPYKKPRFFPLFIGGFPSHVGFFCAQIPVEDELFLRRMIAHVDLKLGRWRMGDTQKSEELVICGWWIYMGNQAKIWKILLEHMMKIYEHIRNIETNLGKYGKRSPELVGKSWEQSYFPASHVLHLDLLSLWFVSCPVVNPQEVGIFWGEGRWGHQANLCLDLWPKSNLVIRTTGDDSEPI